MRGKVFLVASDSHLEPMLETPFAKEDDLQSLLASYPDLLGGDQLDPENPRRWLLVRRELGVPGSDDGGSVWSLDHLFLDQDGIPTFVECKRASDTRIRREVVAQMLDYAANGTEYWSLERIQHAAAETAEGAGRSLDELVVELLGSDATAGADEYWRIVEDNLRQGRVRLLFVADTAPRPLRRLVEFLNAKMQDVEVAIVEVRQFLSDGSSVIVPRVIGVTEQSRAVKGRKPKTDRATMLGMCEPPAARFFAEVLDRCAALGLENNWGVSGFSVRVPYGPANAMTSIMFCYPPNLWQVYLEYVQLPPDAEQALRQELAHYGLETRGKYTMAKNIGAGDTSRALEAFDVALRRLGVTPVG